jgi:hypothetical protein
LELLQVEVVDGKGPASLGGPQEFGLTLVEHLSTSHAEWVKSDRRSQTVVVRECWVVTLVILDEPPS